MKSVNKMDEVVKRTYIVFINNKDITKLAGKSILNNILMGLWGAPITDADFVIKYYELGEDNIWRLK